MSIFISGLHTWDVCHSFIKCKYFKSLQMKTYVILTIVFIHFMPIFMKFPQEPTTDSTRIISWSYFMCVFQAILHYLFIAILKVRKFYQDCIGEAKLALLQLIIFYEVKLINLHQYYILFQSLISLCINERICTTFL